MAIDVGEQDFELEVIERSRQLPVVVDFWASWCGPCRTLGPLLEKAATERQGRMVLAKLDVDANQTLAAGFGVQGIPAVKAFKDGRVVSEFVGAQPRSAVESFLDALLPSEVDELIEAGDEDSLRRALELAPQSGVAALALARLLHSRGEAEEAARLLENAQGDFAAEGLAARIRLEAAEQPELTDAFEAIDGADGERALELLIGAIPSQNGDSDDIRRVAVAVLDGFEPGDPVAREYRRRLAAALY